MTTALRILLLDDDPFMLELMTDMLQGMGYENVRAESDARRALAALPEFGPDLLICDLSMPDMDGIEFLRAAAEAHFDGSVVLLSGMDSGILRAAETLAMAQGLSILGACSKPVPRTDLADMLARAWQQREARARPPAHGGVK
ncbi:response regulator [Pseudoduganella chitinolytica]|uniref:Response regulator n=1 Tax=Pseudoduganella chitinolytica TaxID=34070 RepID=A0ABY8B8M7_9BURK|nr:response regulator [Pseudoduganella chitinolytica]WEF31348.1 response regulator [Pseudoduganella chitinolytica]